MRRYQGRWAHDALEGVCATRCHRKKMAENPSADAPSLLIDPGKNIGMNGLWSITRGYRMILTQDGVVEPWRYGCLYNRLPSVRDMQQEKPDAQTLETIKLRVPDVAIRS